MSVSAIGYQCQRCGNCCRWPGEVVVGEREIREMAAALEISEDEFVESYTSLRRNRSGLTLRQRPDGSCGLLEDGRHCRVHDAKPAQCRAFPNAWRFPGWRQICEAVPVIAEASRE